MSIVMSRSKDCSLTVLFLYSLICNAYGQLHSQGKQYMLDIHNNARKSVGAPNMRKMVLNNVIHNLIHLPNLFKLFKFKGPPNYSIRSFDHLTFNPPFCKTHATAVSFLPSVIKLWNSLPISIRSSQSLSNFKVDLFQFFSTSSH